MINRNKYCVPGKNRAVISVAHACRANPLHVKQITNASQPCLPDQPGSYDVFCCINTVILKTSVKCQKMDISNVYLLEEKPPSFSLFFSYLAYFQVKAACRFSRSIKIYRILYINNCCECFFIIIVFLL